MVSIKKKKVLLLTVLSWKIVLEARNDLRRRGGPSPDAYWQTAGGAELGGCRLAMIFLWASGSTEEDISALFVKSHTRPRRGRPTCHWDKPANNWSPLKWREGAGVMANPWVILCVCTPVCVCVSVCPAMERQELVLSSARLREALSLHNNRHISKNVLSGWLQAFSILLLFQSGPQTHLLPRHAATRGVWHYLRQPHTGGLHLNFS